MGKFSLGKAERLKKEKLIQELFTKGSSFNLYPFRILCLPNQEDEHHKTLFSAPTRHFKKAVDRNKIKRRTREAFRLQKNELNETPALLIGFIYTGREIAPYSQIYDAINKAIKRLNSRDWKKQMA